MRVAVLGAGITGITTAYYLSEFGHEVTVFEKEGSVAAGTSHANAGQLAYSYVDAMANPSFAAMIPRIILGRENGCRFDALGGLRYLPWGFDFLRQCTSARARENTLSLIGVALRSAANLAELREKLALEFDYRSDGKLVMLRGEREVEDARRVAELKLEHDCSTEIISIEQARYIEPALAGMNAGYSAAILAKGDHVGDARKFTVSLAEWLQREGRIDLRIREPVMKLRSDKQKIVGFFTDAGKYRFDVVVACLGVWTEALLRPLGIRTGICPIRGYSITLPLARGTPKRSVTDPQRRIVFTRLGDAVRIAGFADFAGFRAQNDDRRLAQLFTIAKATAPDAADYSADDRHGWGAFRPMTVDGQPRTGATSVGGLYLNTGHGSLGWTLACATAEDVAETITARYKKRNWG